MKTKLRPLLLGAFALAALAACDAPMDHSTMDAGTPPQLAPAKNYLIDLKGNHSHIYRKVAQLFTVYDLDTCTDAAQKETCQKVPGLNVTALTRAPLATFTTEQPLEPGKLEDNGDGTYTVYTEFGTLGAHMVGLRVDEGGRSYFGAFPFETSRGGGEKFFCDTNADSAPDYVFQVRWNGSTGHIMADGMTEVTFSIEVMRSLSGGTLNVTEPWNNPFDHLAPAEITGGTPTIKLMADRTPSATEIATLSPTYKGKGIYAVKRAFSDQDLGGATERTFWLDISFEDSLHCMVHGADAAEDYYFPVVKSATGMQH